jgi:hypothetical protein
MPEAARPTHDQREQLVLTERATFPDFAGVPLSWMKIHDGQIAVRMWG